MSRTATKPPALRVIGEFKEKSTQPTPIQAYAIRYNASRPVFTVIIRRWRLQDVAKCKLCDKCDARDGLCAVAITGNVSDADAPLYSSVGYEIV